MRSAIVDRATFDRVQERLTWNKKDNKKHNYLFVGLIRCFDCNRLMTGIQIRISGHKRKDGTRKHYAHNGYRCSKAYNFKNRCTNRKVIYESVVERYLLENIQSDIVEYNRAIEVAEKPRENNQVKRAAITKKLKKLKELYLNDLITIQEFKEDKAEFEKQLDKLVDIPPQKKNLSHLMWFFLKMYLH